ncbi:MAG TPA: MauE/DoxX family redox-associated membrane protein [Solirubrobacteraceae bacterium]
MGTVVLVLRVALAAVFVSAAIGKLLDRSGSRQALRGFGVPPRVAAVASELLPIVELVIAVALLLRPTAQWGAVAAVVLLLTFVGGIANALVHGWKSACHCFGIFHSEPAGPRALARNGAFLAAAAIAAVLGPGPSISAWVSQRSAAELVAISLGLVAALLIVLLWRLNRQNARLSASLAEQEAALAAIPPGLPVGAIAPAFELTDGRDGATITLESLLARGQPVLLVFIGLGCVPSADLLPDLARWQSTLADRLTLAIVSHGGSTQHQFELQVLEMRDVGLQREYETLQAYRVPGTPSAVLVSPDGRIAAPMALAGYAIEAVVRLTLRNGSSPTPRSQRSAIATGA